MMKDEYNIWEFGSKINIKLKPEFLDLLNKEIKEQYQSRNKFYLLLKSKIKMPYSTIKSKLKSSYSYFVDLELILLICEILNISKIVMQHNILSYKTRHGINYIINPILPVKITPIFDMLIAHHIGDGNLVKSKTNRLLYFAYRQFNIEYKLLYLRKIESVFGKLRFKEDYFLEEHNTRIYYPASISNLMFDVYKLDKDSFYSDKALVPKELFSKSQSHLLAFLIAIIIDEGHIDSSNIIIRMKNLDFVKGLKRICDILNYKTTLTKSKDDMDNLYILSSSLGKFYSDYSKLLNKYPEVNLGSKGKQILNIIKRQNKPKIYLVGNKDNILKLVDKNAMTINDIAIKLNISRQGIRYLVKELLKENKIKTVGIMKFGNILYMKVK